MEKNNLLTLVITLTVGIILTGSLLASVIADATTTERTFTNDGAFYVEVDPSDTYTIKYDKVTENGIVYINDDVLDVDFSTGYTIFAIDNAILRLQSSDSTLQYKGDGHYFTGIIKLDLTISNGAVTGKYQTGINPGVDVTWPTTTYTTAFVASPTPQEFVMTEYNSDAKINNDDKIIAFGQTYLSTSGDPKWALINITGNIKDGVTVDVLDSTTGEALTGATVENLSINATKVDGYKTLYDLTSITFDVTYDGATTAVTYSAYVVPATVTSELSTHLNPAEIALMNALPILIIVGLVALAAEALVIKNRD